MNDKPSYSLKKSAAQKSPPIQPAVNVSAGIPKRVVRKATERLLRPGRLRSGEAKPLKQYPDAAAIAHLVAQPRFAELSNEGAIDAALELLHDCQTALENEMQAWDEAREINKEIDERPRPPEFPASLADFYRLAVKAGKKDVNQPRFKKFLRHWSEAYERVRLDNLDYMRRELARLEHQIADAAKRGTTLIRASVPGSMTAQEAADKYKQAIAEGASIHLDAGWLEKEVEACFESYAKDGIDSFTWDILCDEYPAWWLPERAESKARGGRARAKKARETKKKRKK